MILSGIFRPGMRTYFIPFLAGIALAVSAFLPWVSIGDVTLDGVPETAASGCWASASSRRCWRCSA